MCNRIKCFLLIGLFFCGIEAKASCSASEYQILKDKADKIELLIENSIETSSDYMGETKEANYTITAYNYDNSLKLYVKYNNDDDELYQFINNENITKISNLYSGDLKIYIISNNYTCKDRSIKVISKKLPYYNTFYESESCKNNLGFKYCKNEYIDDFIDEYIFDKELAEYKKSEINTNNNSSNKENGNNFFLVITFIVAILIVIAFFVIKLIIKERKKHKL